VARADGRRPSQLRQVQIVRGYTDFAPGSVLMMMGKTRVLCTASLEQGVPEWREALGGWLTAEYDMLPAATGQRRSRNRFRLDGRTQEIQRVIGRALRAVVDLKMLGPNTVWIDCDVLQADGGTRTAGITGAFVALHDALRFAQSRALIKEWPIRDSVAAVSVGRVGGRLVLDLTYEEDSAAEVDLNVAVTGSGELVEVQGSGESATFARGELDRMLTLAMRGIRQLQKFQRQALARPPGGGNPRQPRSVGG
jgi:ribonuclease PH